MLSDQRLIGLSLCFLAACLAWGVFGYRLGLWVARRRWVPQIERLEGICGGSAPVGPSDHLADSGLYTLDRAGREISMSGPTHGESIVPGRGEST